jgi:ribonuclease P protein component
MIVHIVDKEVFQEVIGLGYFAKTDHFVLHIKKTSDVRPISNQNTGPNLMVGTVLPKRLAKRAVTRNAIRRQIYIVANKYSIQHSNEIHVIRLSRPFDKTVFTSASSKELKRVVYEELLSLYGCNNSNAV